MLNGPSAVRNPAGRNRACATTGEAVRSEGRPLVKDHALAADARAWDGRGPADGRILGWGPLRLGLIALGQATEFAKSKSAGGKNDFGGLDGKSAQLATGG